jgi:hypothetical protein
MVANERGGRKEAFGLWAWKLETIEPGARAEVTYSLVGLEKGDWNETEIFYRGAGNVIGASVLDEKILADIRKQEEKGYEIIATEQHDSAIEIIKNPIETLTDSTSPPESQLEPMSKPEKVPSPTTDPDPGADVDTEMSPISGSSPATGADDLGQSVMNKTTDLFKQQKLFDGGGAQ